MNRHLRVIIEKAIRAPSGHNTQPWKFLVEDSSITIKPDYSRRLPVADADDHGLFISLGCALENLLIAAGHYGYAAQMQISTENNPSIRVQLQPGTALNSSPLFVQIDRRQSTRNKYNGKPIPEVHIKQLMKASCQEDTHCIILTKKEEINSITPLVMEGCEKHFRNPAFVHELMHWIRFSQLKAEKTRDGLSVAVTGSPFVPEWLGKLVMGVTISPLKEAKKCAASIESASALALFVAEKDDVQSWINLGRSFERFALTATSLNIHHSYENMACGDREVREKLAQLLLLQKDQQPLLLVRIGYSAKMPHSHRRPVEELIVHQAATLIYE